MGEGSSILGSEVFWLAAAAFAQILIVFSIPTSIWLYGREEKRSLDAAQEQERLAKEQFQKEERDKFYAQLDEMYLKILHMIVENPKLGTTSIERSEFERIQYDAFAFIMWNFIESIYDFCRQDEVLAKTWHCILECESSAHADWFKVPANRRKFKSEFCSYIDSL
jgi:hypothetical protein